MPKSLTKSTISTINKVVNKHRLVDDRVDELESKGFQVAKKPMGSGGVGQIKETKSEIRYQIGYGTGKHNYAYAVIFKK